MLGPDGELVLNLQRAKVRTVVDTYDRVRAQRLGDVVVVRCSRGHEDFEHHRPADRDSPGTGQSFERLSYVDLSSRDQTLVSSR